jgi:muramoyltetrapeptide carboxypeptidase LdcA involved in peptidoglycan recycling
VKLADGIEARDSYVAGDPKSRARDLEAMFAFFEEVDTPPWYVDGMLTQLGQAGKLAGVAGVAVGKL